MRQIDQQIFAASPSGTSAPLGGVVDQKLAGFVVRRRRVEPAVANQHPKRRPVDRIRWPLEREQQDRVRRGQADAAESPPAPRAASRSIDRG